MVGESLLKQTEMRYLQKSAKQAFRMLFTFFANSVPGGGGGRGRGLLPEKLAGGEKPLLYL